jgi:hypothetical protein
VRECRGEHRGEYQVADEDRLDKRERAEVQYNDLQYVGDDVHADRGQPPRLLPKIQQQPR